MMEIAASSECGNTPYFSFYSFFFKDGQGPVIRLPVKVFVQYFLEHIKIAGLAYVLMKIQSGQAFVTVFACLQP